LRAERQEGTFTYFSKPCSFYLQHGEFPCIEYYDRHLNNSSAPSFELIRYTLERTTPNLSFIQNILASKGINEAFLLPSIESKGSTKSRCVIFDYTAELYAIDYKHIFKDGDGTRTRDLLITKHRGAKYYNKWQ
jgi:hypothetical protein